MKFDCYSAVFGDCGCRRRIWDLLGADAARKAVEIAEEYANGRTTTQQLRTACVAAARCMAEDEEILAEGIDLYRSNQAIMTADESIDQPLRIPPQEFPS